MGGVGSAICRTLLRRATVLAVNGETLSGPQDSAVPTPLETPSTGAASVNADTGHSWRELLERRRFTAARNAYLVAGEQDVNVRAALNALVDVQELVRERSFEKAHKRIERLEQRPAIVPWDEMAAEILALKASSSALDRRDPDSAREQLAEVEASWFPAESLSQLGTSLIYDDDLTGAEESFLAAIDLDPDHYRAITNLGNVLLEQGRVDEAIELYQRALKVDEEFPNAHHNLGVAYRRKGQLSKSVRSLRRAQKTQHRHEVAEARESIGKWAGPGFAKTIKWIVYGAIAVGGYFILRATGFI